MKRLYKSRKEKVIDGVCGGIAEYFEVDPVLVRIVFVLFFFVGGAAFLAYIIGMIIMKRQPQEGEEGQETSDAKSVDAEVVTGEGSKPARANPGSLVFGLILIAIGSFFLLENLHIFRGFYWWFRHNFWDWVIPGIVVAFGVALIVRSTDK